MNLLIVDDHPANRQRLRAQLEAGGHTVFEAADGVDALALLERQPVDAVISDILMPRMDGYRLCLGIRKHPPLQDLPVIIYTATYTSPDDEKLALDVGADKYLTKPASDEIFLAALKEVTARPRATPRTEALPELEVLKEYSEWLVAKLEQKNLELAAAQEKFSLQATAMATAANAIIITDHTGRMIWVNEAFTTMTGYSAAEALRRTPRILKSGQHDAAFYQDFWKTINSGQTWRGEFINRRKDGSLYHDEHTVTPIRDAGGRITHFIGILNDITARKQVEEALQASEQRYRELFENAHDLIQCVTADGHFAYVNPAWERALGYSKEEVARLTLMDIIHPDSRAHCLERFGQLMSGQKVDQMEVRFITKTGQTLIVDGAASCDRVNQTPRHVQCIFRDITERKQAEQRIRQLNRVYAVLSGINETIVRVKDPQAMLEAACRIAVEKGQFRMAWVGMLDAARQKVTPVASAGVIDGYLDNVKLDLGEETRNISPGARALLTGEHKVCNDIETDPGFGPWRQEALRRGYRAAAAFPLKRAGRTEGVFKLYATEPGFFTDEETHLLDELAADVGFALEVHQQEEERRRAESDLAWKTAFLEALVHSSFDGLLVVDEQGRKLLQNQRFNELWQIPRHIIDSEDDAEQLHFATSRAKHPQQFAERVAHLYAHPDESSRDEVELIDGTVLDRHSAPVLGKDGKYYGRIWSFRDITARKRAEEAVREKERRFRLLIENALDLITVINHEGVIRFQSPSSERVLGHPADELVGRNALEFIHPDDVPRVGAAIQTAAKDPSRPISVEFQFKHRDGTWRFLAATGQSIPGEAAEGYIVVNSRDLTEHRKLETEFRQAQKMDAIGRLAGGVAHDFNNLLTVIAGYASLLRAAQSLRPDEAESVREIALAGERAAQLTRQLLAFSRKQVLQPRVLDLNEVVDGVVKMLRRVVGEDIRLQVRPGAGRLPLRADQGMLEQVLLNLAVNARDAMPNGGQLIIETSHLTVDETYVRANPEAAADHYVSLTVTDTGCGIAPEHLNRIFEPFFTTKEPGRGTGLGLATVHGIVKQHQGWINVYSHPGQGATFRVYLPAAPAGEAAPPAAPATKEARGGSETILVVEDEANIRTLVRMVLERQGYTVIEAASGVEALARWAEHRDRIALVLTDMVMPDGLSGTDLAGKLLIEKPHLKIIFSSGYSAEVFGRRLELAEGWGFLQKPYDLRALCRLVRDCLDGRRSGG